MKCATGSGIQITFGPWTNLSRYHLCWKIFTILKELAPNCACWVLINWSLPRLTMGMFLCCLGRQGMYGRMFCRLFLGKITGFMSFSSANSCNFSSIRFHNGRLHFRVSQPQCLLFAVEIHHNSIFNFYSLSPTRDRKTIYLLS